MHIYSNILSEEAQHYLHSINNNYYIFIPYFLCRLTMYSLIFSGSTLLLATQCANCVSFAHNYNGKKYYRQNKTKQSNLCHNILETKCTLSPSVLVFCKKIDGSLDY